jgi:hypothetical protein
MTIAKSLADIITPTGGLTAAEIVASSTLNVSGATTLSTLTATGKILTSSANIDGLGNVVATDQAVGLKLGNSLGNAYIFKNNSSGGGFAGSQAGALSLGTSTTAPVEIGVNNSVRARFDYNGNVSLTGGLDVTGATTLNALTTIIGPAGNGNPAIIIQPDNAAGINFVVQRDAGGAGTLDIGTNTSHNVDIIANGVTVMTATPAGNATFVATATANQLVGSPSAFNPVSSGAANAGLLLSGSYGGGVGWRDGANSDWGAWIQNSGDDWVLGFNTTQGASLANLITVNGPTGNAAFAGGVAIGTFSPSGASAGQTTNSAGLTDWSTATTNSINAWAFFNPTGNVGAIKTSGSATVYTTSSDPRLKSEFVAIDDALAAQMVKDAVENKWVGVFNFKADDSEPVAGYNAHALIDNQLGYGGSEGEGPREAEIGDVYEVATYEQATDEDGELLFDDVTETATRPKTWQKPIMETFDEVVPAVTEQQAVINEETGEPEIITVVVEEETTRKAERQKTEPFTETVTVAEAIVDGVLIPEHEETKTTDKPMFTTENVVDQAGNVVTEEYQKVVGTEPRMVEVTPEKVVSPAGVDQSKRVPLLEAALYNALKRIEALEAK